MLGKLKRLLNASRSTWRRDVACGLFFGAGRTWNWHSWSAMAASMLLQVVASGLLWAYLSAERDKWLRRLAKKETT